MAKYNTFSEHICILFSLHIRVTEPVLSGRGRLKLLDLMRHGVKEEAAVRGEGPNVINGGGQPFQQLFMPSPIVQGNIRTHNAFSQCNTKHCNHIFVLTHALYLKNPVFLWALMG